METDELDFGELLEPELAAVVDSRRTPLSTAPPPVPTVRASIVSSAWDDLLYAADPVRWAREAAAFEPDPWQAKLLAADGRRVILNCSRQVGKSTSTAAVVLHHAIYKPKAMVLLISPSQRQSSELFQKIAGFYKSLPNPPALEDDNRLSMKLARNGSRIVSLPSSDATVRGFSGVTMLVEDEAAYVSDRLYRAVRPMLATTGGSHYMLSSPFGKRGHFHDEWHREGSPWTKIAVQATECPRITSEFLDEERLILGEAIFAQEYMCAFLDETTSYFSPGAVRAMRSDEVEVLDI